MAKALDLTNKRFGRLTAIKFAYSKKDSNGVPVRYWVCKCDCGNTLITRVASLRSGSTKSCGCLHTDKLIERNYKHGLSDSTLYNSWSNMKERCLNPNHPKYMYYGGRGITVCEDWLDFEIFKKWALSNGFKDEKKRVRNRLSLDRINVNGNYEPSNCRWATDSQQANNKRITKRYFFQGKSLTIREWANETGISYHTLYSRLNECGWSVENALLIKPSHKNFMLRISEVSNGKNATKADQI